MKSASFRFAINNTTITMSTNMEEQAGSLIKKTLWDQLSFFIPPAAQETLVQPVSVPALESVSEDFETLGSGNERPGDEVDNACANDGSSSSNDYHTPLSSPFSPTSNVRSGSLKKVNY